MVGSPLVNSLSISQIDGSLVRDGTIITRRLFRVIQFGDRVLGSLSKSRGVWRLCLFDEL